MAAPPLVGGRHPSTATVKVKVKAKVKRPRLKEAHRNRVRAAFWILGLCNNYGYVVMISAAYEILGENFGLAEVKHGQLQIIQLGTE